MRSVILVTFVTVGLIPFLSSSGQTQDRTGNFSACANSIDACTELLDTNARQRAVLLTMRALVYEANGNIRSAASDLTEAIGLDQKLASAFHARADLLRNNNQCDLALADYDQAINLLPDQAPIYLQRGICRLDQNMIDGGIADLDKAVTLDAGNKAGIAVAALGTKATLYGLKGDFKSAIESLDEAIAMDPTQPSLFLDRGKAWRESGDPGKAKQDFEQTIKFDEGNASGYAADARTLMARMEASGGNLDAALAEYDEAIRLDSKRTALYLDRAKLWNQKGDSERALADYNQALNTAPSAAAYLSRADFRRGKGDYDLAIADYDKAIEQADDLSAYADRALAKFYQGNFSKATSDFKHVVDAQLNAYPALLLYISKSREGDAREAKSEFTKNASKLKPGEWPYPIIELYLGKKSLQAAEGAAKTRGEKCEAQFYIGEWHLLRKDRSDAAKALQAAVDSCPKDFVEYRAAVEELKRLK